MYIQVLCGPELDNELIGKVSIDAQGAETNGKNTVGMKQVRQIPFGCVVHRATPVLVAEVFFNSLTSQEIAQLKQNLFNRETSLQTANHTIKRLEKEKAGLEYGKHQDVLPT